MEVQADSDDYQTVLTARVAFEAALVVSDSEDARVAWRFYHETLAGNPNPERVHAARRLLDEVIVETGDAQLVEAKRRYDAALRGSDLSA